MQPEFYIGLDVHRKSIVTNVKDPMGRVLDKAKLGASDAELVGYLRRFDGIRHVVLEACCVWSHVYDAAATVAQDVTLAHPRKTRLIAEATLKSDKVDAAALSELLRLNGVATAYAPDPEIRGLRALVRERHFHKSLEKSVKNHTYSVLIARGHPYEDGVLGLKRKREALRLLKIPEVDRGLDALKDLETRCKQLDQKVHEAFVASKEAQLLESIPGIGELNAVTLVAELCPIDRFANIEKVSSYAGLVPTNYQSAESSYHGRLKQMDANHFLRTVLVEASWAHRRFASRTSDVVKIGNRVARKKGAGKGGVAAAHKLIKIVYAVLKRGTPYTPERPSRDLFPADP